MRKPRDEYLIFEDLTKLTVSPGYVHAVAQMCVRDNVIYVKGKLKPSDMHRLFNGERLTRTELTTLIGLMAKNPLVVTQKPAHDIEDQIRRTDVLMKELHDSIAYPLFDAFHEAMKAGTEPPNPWHGPGMREPIFYGSESAYAFQYRDFVPDKFGADDDWLISVKGFSSSQARSIAKTMCALMDEKVTRLFAQTRSSKNQMESWLPAFEFSASEVAHRSEFAQDVIDAFFRAFLFTGKNEAFSEVGDFNEVTARPLLPTGRGTVLLFSQYAIYEALYESPFFWMMEDMAYRQTAAKHRGAFTEQFASRQLTKVFGCHHVHTNVRLHRGKGIVGEADVLVIYGDRIIVVQAKAKKLTIAARKGNDSQLKADFAAAIQDSYDQGWACANELLAGDCRLVDDSENELKLPARVKEIFLFSLVSEHYPALAFQASQLLKFQVSKIIRPPFVMDVFLLDILTEMLATPLRLLSYVRQRVALSERLMSGHELTVLGYHLSKNLWIDEKYDLVILEDSVVQDLDSAMYVRRDNLPGDDTPVGILTKMRGTRYESLIKEIEARAEPATLELGFHLLSMDEESCRNVHRLLHAIMRKTQLDGKRHDATLASSRPPIGVCFHCNPIPSPDAVVGLETHCAKRKYRERASQWFGVSVNPDGQVQFGVTLDFPWESSEELDQLTAGMSVASRLRDVLPEYIRKVNRIKIGRNDPCPCGSGLKHKKCCLQ